jgi:hypothetical protein
LILAERNVFAAGFRRSARGNLWRPFEYDEASTANLCVFARGDRWCYSIANSDGPRYSEESYETERDALTALFLEVREW